MGYLYEAEKPLSVARVTHEGEPEFITGSAYQIQATHHIRLSVTAPTIDESVSVPRQRRFLALNMAHQSDADAKHRKCFQLYCSHGVGWPTAVGGARVSDEAKKWFRFHVTSRPNFDFKVFLFMSFYISGYFWIWMHSRNDEIVARSLSTSGSFSFFIRYSNLVVERSLRLAKVRDLGKAIRAVITAALKLTQSFRTAERRFSNETMGLFSNGTRR